MDISDTLLCVFSAEVDERDGGYVVDVPENEVGMGDLRAGDVYRVAVLSRVGRDGGRPNTVPEPPVDQGEVREVEIEDIGAQGDGIAKVERGYIVFVPGTGIGDRVTIEITDVSENFAFAEVVGDDADPDASEDADGSDSR